MRAALVSALLERLDAQLTKRRPASNDTCRTYFKIKKRAQLEESHATLCDLAEEKGANPWSTSSACTLLRLVAYEEYVIGSAWAEDTLRLRHFSKSAETELMSLTRLQATQRQAEHHLEGLPASSGAAQSTPGKTSQLDKARLLLLSQLRCTATLSMFEEVAIDERNSPLFHGASAEHDTKLMRRLMGAASEGRLTARGARDLVKLAAVLKRDFGYCAPAPAQ